MKKFLVEISALLCLLLPSCKTQYLPLNNSVETEVRVVDSVAIRYLDSIRVTELLKVRNYAWRDTLFLEGNRSRAWAAIDSTRELDILVGELEEDAVEERYVFKDRLVFKDSLKLVETEREVPVEVTVEKKVIPKWVWYSLALNILGVISGALVIYLKVKGKILKL